MKKWNNLNISNVIPRRDTDGNILDAHGGAHFNTFENRYYNYGVHYMGTDGFSHDQHYVNYSSTDFENWEFHGRLLEESAPEGLYFRPHVLFSSKLQKYVCGTYGMKSIHMPPIIYVTKGWLSVTILLVLFRYRIQK